MQHGIRKRSLLMVALSGLWSLSLGPLTADVSPPALPLVALADGQASGLASATARADFGRRSVLDTTAIARTFVLRSRSAKPLTIDRLQPSCRCTTAVVEGVKDEAPPFTLAPGAQARVRVIISPGDALPGPFTKEVYVFAAGDTVPTATLQLSGTLTPPVTFEPATLDFGRTPDQATQPLTVTVDRRLLAPGKTFQLRCDDPSVLLRPDGPGMFLLTIQQVRFSLSAGVAVQKYTVTLRNHRPGPLRAILSVVPGGGVSPAFGSDAWGTALVTGEVVPPH